MSVRPFRTVPTNQREWDQYLRELAITPDEGSVTEGKFADNAVSNRALRDSAPNSVIGRVPNTPGDPADIAIANGQFLGTRGGVTGGFTLSDTDIPATIARDAEVAAAVATAIAAAIAALPKADDAQYILAHKIFGA